jgi:hypothetical protein
MSSIRTLSPGPLIRQCLALARDGRVDPEASPAPVASVPYYRRSSWTNRAGEDVVYEALSHGMVGEDGSMRRAEGDILPEVQPENRTMGCYMCLDPVSWYGVGRSVTSIVHD